MENNNYIESVLKQFEYYKTLGEKTIAQVEDHFLFWKYNDESNSIATIVQHLSGNMLSRWTDFLDSDGEKEWRKRDEEFENNIQDRAKLMQIWNKGWDCLLATLKTLSQTDLSTIIYIRNQGHTVLEAINRQLAHYPYHIGQIVYIGKMALNNDWKTLSIAKNNSNDFNRQKFAKERHREHFTDETIHPE